MKKILGLGNALVDVIISLKDEELLFRYNLPKGSMQLVDKELASKIEADAKGFGIQLASGGSAANTIHGLAKLGTKTGYIGKIGRDNHGAFFKKNMKSIGIRASVNFGSADTGRAITLVTPDSERTFATYLGSAVELGLEDIPETILKDYIILHLEGYLMQNHDLFESVLKRAKNLNVLVSLDFASYNVVEANLDFLKYMVKNYVDIVFANEEEARAFTGKEPDEALNEIAEVCDIAVVKTGKSGSLIKQHNHTYAIGIVEVTAVDTTGAGDLYAAGFLYGYSSGLPLDKCGKIGALLAGKVIEDYGAKLAERKWSAIQDEVAGIVEE